MEYLSDMGTKVVNRRTDKYDVYIGRPTCFGNPFKIGKDGTREEVIEKYREYFYCKLETNPLFKGRVLELKGKTLACWCKPDACHGDVIANYLNNEVN